MEPMAAVNSRDPDRRRLRYEAPVTHSPGPLGANVGVPIDCRRIPPAQSQESPPTGGRRSITKGTKSPCPCITAGHTNLDPMQLVEELRRLAPWRSAGLVGTRVSPAGANPRAPDGWTLRGVALGPREADPVIRRDAGRVGSGPNGARRPGNLTNPNAFARLCGQ
jgi:hypothetical protein